MEPQRYKKTRVLLLLLAISLLLHLIVSFFFLEFGFKKRFTSFITTLSGSIANLSREDKQKLERKKELKREALQKIFEEARKNKKVIKEPICFIDHKPKPKFEIKPKPDNKSYAKLVAPKCDFGWVTFDDNYKKPKEFKIPKTKDGDLIKSEESDVTEIHPENFNTLKDVGSKVIIPEIRVESKIAQKQEKILHKKVLSEKNIDIKESIKDKPVEILKAISNTAIIDEIKIATEASTITQEQEKELSLEPINASVVENKIKEENEEVSSSVISEQVVQQESIQLDKAQERNALLSAILKNKNKPNDDNRPIYKASKGSKFIWGLNNSESEDSQKNGPLPKGYAYKPFGEDGSDLIDTYGDDPNKKLSLEEMELIKYEVKIRLSVSATWKYHKDFYTNLPLEAGTYPVVKIDYEIDSSGLLINSKISQSSGVEVLDKVALRIFRFASPFPPPPKSFNTNVYKSLFPWRYIPCLKKSCV